VIPLLGAATLGAALATGALRWRNIGPAVAGGRVAAVAGTDADPLLYYFGAAGGGVFETKNGGLTWTDVWAGQTVGAIGALAIAPSNRKVVWVGTGESKPRNDASYGDGVWVSHDGGATWHQRGLQSSHAIAKILVDPHDPDSALAGALGDPYRDGGERGVYRTTDGGRTWQRTLAPGPHSGVSDMDWSPRAPKTVFAGIWQIRRVPWSFTSGGPDDALYKSSDGGRTWRRLAGNGLPGGFMGRIGVAVAPSDPRRVYALIQSAQGLLWRSDDAGEHWRMMSRDTLIDQRPFYMSRLAVDPTDRNHVYFASEDVIESRDGGRSFDTLDNAVHQDHHGFWIARDGKRMIEANDGAAPISLDGGKLWDWRFNAVIGQIYHAGYDAENPYHVCGGLQDNDSYCGPSNSLSQLGILNSDWRDVGNDGDGSWVWPEPGRPSAIWNVGVNALNGQLGIFDLASRQNLDISPYVRDTNGRALDGLPYRFNWEAPVAFSPRDPGVAYFGGNVVFATRDRGRTWKAISPDLTRNDPQKQQVAGGPINTDVSGAEFYDTILDIAPSPLDPAVIWVGTDDGLIQLTRDGGAHWQNVTVPQVGPWGRVETVEPSHETAGEAFAVVDRHLMGDRTPYIFATADYGASWRLVTSGLPAGEYARVVRQDPAAPGILYAGLEQGVWLSLDAGAHWEALRLNMPPVAVRDLRVQPQQGDLIAATHGRGFWILDDLAPLRELGASRSAPRLFAIRAAYDWYFWWASGYGTGSGECCAPIGEFSGPNPESGSLISYYLPSEQKTAPRIEVVDAAGGVVRALDGTKHAGINRVAWDLTENPPVEWTSAREWNRGPSTGVTVVPGRYGVRLKLPDASLEGAALVEPDPRAQWTPADYVLRHDFLRTLYDELSSIDEALNELDTRKRRAGPAERARIGDVEAALTSNPLNSEDDQWRPDRLRERIQTLISTLSLSQGPPLEPHLREAAEIKTEYDAALRTYRSYRSHEGLP
jgi:photosystem II stability/assembly factor-like uncharacterized protein